MDFREIDVNSEKVKKTMFLQIRVVSQETRLNPSHLDDLYNLFKVGQKWNSHFGIITRP